MTDDTPPAGRRQKGRATVNIIDVAKAAELSTATVSRALRSPEKVSEPTRERVFAAVEAVGYRPNMLARNLRSDRSFSVLVLVPGIANPFFANVIAGIEAVATDRGYSVLLGDTRDEPEREDHFTALVETRLADGVIQLSPDYRTHADGDAPGYPTVHACGCELTPPPSVRIDNVGAARDVVAHLIAQGHRRIAAIAGPKTNPHAQERLEGYRQAHAAAAIACDPALVVHAPFGMASGVQAARRLLAGAERPTAIFCMNDEMAIGAMQVLAAAGLRIPADVAVAGFDGIDIAEHCIPALTTVEQPAFQMGVRACELLLDRIEGAANAEVVEILPHRIAVRHSTAAVAATTPKP